MTSKNVEQSLCSSFPNISLPPLISSTLFLPPKIIPPLSTPLLLFIFSPVPDEERGQQSSLLLIAAVVVFLFIDCGSIDFFFKKNINNSDGGSFMFIGCGSIVGCFSWLFFFGLDGRETQRL